MAELKLDLMLTENGEHHLMLSLPKGPHVMTAEHVETLIQALGQQRELIPPAVTRESPAGPRTGVLDPRWYLAHEPMIDGGALHFRHPGLGWVSFGLPLESLRELHLGIGKILNQVEDDRRSTPVN